MESFELPENTLRHPFDAVPVVADGVDVHRVDELCVYLARNVPPKPGLLGCLARRLGQRNTARIQLDEIGSTFWNLVDGQASLRDIERQLRHRHGLTGKESEKTTLQFTQMLMIRHLVYLKVPEGERVP